MSVCAALLRYSLGFLRSWVNQTKPLSGDIFNWKKLINLLYLKSKKKKYMHLGVHVYTVFITLVENIQPNLMRKLFFFSN